MTVPPITGVLETSLYVSDLDAAERFYREVFGFEPFPDAGDAQRMRALGVAPGQVLLLFRHGGSTNPSPLPRGPGLIPGHDSSGRQHLCFSIPASALESWAARLEGRRCAIESRVTWGRGGTSLYCRDPDGHCIEVATPGLWPNY